jgi:hypothetical protein
MQTKIYYKKIKTKKQKFMGSFVVFYTSVLFFLYLPTLAYAQINESDTARFQARIVASGNWQTGNVEMFAMRGKVDMAVLPTRSLAFKTQNAYLYQEFFKRKADEDFFSRNFIYFQPTRTIYPFMMAFVSTNFRRNIDFRYFVGAGATWQIIKTKNHLTKIALSGVYEETNFKKTTFNELAYNGQEHIKTWRATAWLFGKHHLLQNKLIFHYDCYIQPSLERNDNFRWQAETGFDIPFYKGFNFTTNFIYTYESVVVETAKTDDAIITFGISLKI